MVIVVGQNLSGGAVKEDSSLSEFVLWTAFVSTWEYCSQVILGRGEHGGQGSAG